MGAEFIPVILIKNSCGRRTTTAVPLCWAGVQWPKVNALKGLLPYGQLHRGPKCRLPYWEIVPRSSSFPHPKPLFAYTGWLQRSWPRADVCKCVRQEGMGVASFLERRPLPERPPCQHCLIGHVCLTLPAHSSVQSSCPLVPAEHLPGPLGALPSRVSPCGRLGSLPIAEPAPSAACQGARCCHWKKLLHNLKSWSFDHCSERMKRRGSKWWFENASFC